MGPGDYAGVIEVTDPSKWDSIDLGQAGNWAYMLRILRAKAYEAQSDNEQAWAELSTPVRGRLLGQPVAVIAHVCCELAQIAENAGQYKVAMINAGTALDAIDNGNVSFDKERDKLRGIIDRARPFVPADTEADDATTQAAEATPRLRISRPARNKLNRPDRPSGECRLAYEQCIMNRRMRSHARFFFYAIVPISLIAAFRPGLDRQACTCGMNSRRCRCDTRP